MMYMKICIVYYSRTGNTAYVVEVLKKAFSNISVDVDIYRVFPIREYSRPLHINPRVIYDTLMRRGTDIRFDPEKPMLENYSIVIIASPIWIGRLAPPIQRFLKSYVTSIKNLVIITTSAMSIDCRRIEKNIAELWSLKPMLCINISVTTIKDSTKLKQLINDIVKKLIEILGK